MQKALVLMFLCFIVLGYTIMPVVLADNKGKGNSITGSVSGSNGDSDSSDGIDDSDEVSDDEAKERIRERVKERLKERDGKSVREIEMEFEREGEKIKIKRKIKFKDGEFEIETRLRVEGNGSNLSILDSEGIKHRIRVTPERLRTLLLERLNASNVTNFSLEEIKHKNIPRVVYKINSDHPGRFLGIFKIALRAETQVDPETGEILSINGPWWAFLVAEQIPDEDEVVGNETIEGEIVASDDELEEELEAEVEEEVEVEDEVDDSEEDEIEDEDEAEDEEEDVAVNNSA